MLRRAAGAVSAPLRRSLCTAASRPPWAMVYSRAALDASGAPSPGARASLDLGAAPYVSHISVPAHLADGMEFAGASVRATSSDGLLLLDLAETRHLPPGPSGGRESLDRPMLLEFSAAGAASELDAARFVCNPLSGQLFRLPVPNMDAAYTSTAFGLLTQSDGSHGRGAPDRFVVAQLSCMPGNRKVVRRFLSETGEWDERHLVVPATVPDWPRMQIDINREVLALGDRLWWVDLTWGAFSVDPFSDRPEHQFVELPHGSVLSDFDISDNLLLGRRRLMGVSEGKLRYIEVSTENEFVVSSFALEEGCCWKPTRETTVKLVLPNKRKPLEEDMPWIVAIDPFNANTLYFQHGHTIIAMDMAKGEAIGKMPFPDSITGLSPYNMAFFVPCVLPTWLESNHIPGAGTLSNKNTNCETKTLADMLVRADRD